MQVFRQSEGGSILKGYIYLAIAAGLCAFLIIILRNTRVLKKLAVSTLGGVAALGAVNLSSAFTGVNLAVNLWTIGAAVILGLPGITTALFLKLIWKI